MRRIHQIIKCSYCGGNFKLHTSENKEGVEELRDFVSKPIPEDKYWSMLICHPIIHKESDLIYGLCAHCCAHTLRQILSHIVARQREILFRKFN